MSAAHKKLRIQFRKSFNKTKCYECTHCSKTFNLERVLNKHFFKEHEQENCEICPNCGKKVVHLDIHLKNCDKEGHSEEVRNSLEKESGVNQISEKESSTESIEKNDEGASIFEYEEMDLFELRN